MFFDELNNGESWELFSYNISNHPNFNSNVNSNFAIKFQQYDNYRLTDDGRIWDDIYINFTLNFGVNMFSFSNKS